MEKKITYDKDSLIATINEWLWDFLHGLGIPEQLVVYTKMILLLLFVIIVVYALQKGVSSLLNFILKRAAKITKINLFDYAVKNRLPHFLALVIPYSFVRGSIPVVFYSFPSLISPTVTLTDIYMVFMVIWTIMAILYSLGDMLQERPAFHNKPMKSYMQVIQIIFYILGAVVIYCIFTGKSPAAFFAAMGAASAILMLMFKDTIMGFVSSIQLSSNDMLRIGDWITMNKYGADGDVEEINLTTVKIRNFDKTITTIPTYAMISDSYQNWRGMQESGGRRIKRPIFIKQSSIRFLTEEELEKYKGLPGLGEFIKQKEKGSTDKVKLLADSLHTNKLLLTNNDLFMQYGIHYLRNHPRISQGMTLLVRQLAPTTEGLPIEIYTFTDTTVWAQYEGIMAEVMNHFITIAPFFDLLLFEVGSSSDEYVIINKSN